MAQPRCHYCEDDAGTQCATCGRMYCDEHGEDVCLRCMAPESATPSAGAYRGALVALMVGTLVGVFLIVSPPGSGEAASGEGRPLPAPGQQLAPVTPTMAARTTATVGATAMASASASAVASPAGSATAPAGGERTHVVVAGDTLSRIAVTYGTTVDAILALNAGVTADNITIGQTLKIPGR